MLILSDINKNSTSNDVWAAVELRGLPASFPRLHVCSFVDEGRNIAASEFPCGLGFKVLQWMKMQDRNRNVEVWDACIYGDGGGWLGVEVKILER